ncbi:unnamed protein product [Periconia digitata]|uniref:Uncharacterized protein n=1 Tax=Periconia digitata TaxID=1303443 RepID=A0A9W4UUE2_9PLEO|nr:unnamed protein product [Periconia digitata]
MKLEKEGFRVRLLLTENRRPVLLARRSTIHTHEDISVCQSARLVAVNLQLRWFEISITHIRLEKIAQRHKSNGRCISKQNEYVLRKPPWRRFDPFLKYAAGLWNWPPSKPFNTTSKRYGCDGGIQALEPSLGV